MLRVDSITYKKGFGLFALCLAWGLKNSGVDGLSAAGAGAIVIQEVAFQWELSLTVGMPMKVLVPPAGISSAEPTIVTL